MSFLKKLLNSTVHHKLSIPIATILLIMVANYSTYTFYKKSPEEIHVLRLAPAGGGIAAWSDAVVETLTQNGYPTKLIALNSYKEGQAWQSANPDKPTVFVSFSDNAVFDKHFPNHPAASHLNVNETNLITIVGKWWNFICGKSGQNDTIEALRTSPGAKIGVWNFPVALAAAQAHMQAIGANVQIVGFASGRDQLQAFVSGDVDYLIMSSEGLAHSVANISCFATSAPTQIAKEKMQRVAYETLTSDLPFNGYGLWPILVGENVDTQALRTVFHKNPSPTYTKLQSSFIPNTDPLEVQLQDLAKIGEDLKANFNP